MLQHQVSLSPSVAKFSSQIKLAPPDHCARRTNKMLKSDTLKISHLHIGKKKAFLVYIRLSFLEYLQTGYFSCFQDAATRSKKQLPRVRA